MFSYRDWLTGYNDNGADTYERAKKNAELQQNIGYKSPWEEQLKEAMDKILNREEFNYDLNGDAFYQQYKDKYVKQGQQAMMDTIGQQAALTGGYANSWAQSAGQQAYHGQLDKLNDVIPELQKIALDKYNAEGQELYNQFGLIQSMDERDFQAYQEKEALKKWLASLDDVTRNYYLTFGVLPNEEDYNMDNQGTFPSFNHGTGLGSGSGSGSGKGSGKGSVGDVDDELVNEIIRGEWGNGQDRKDALKAAGYSDAEIKAIQAEVNKQFGSGGGGEDDTVDIDKDSYDYDDNSLKIQELIGDGASKEEIANSLYDDYKNGDISKETYDNLIKNFNLTRR